MRLFLIVTLFLFLSCNGQKKTAMQKGARSNQGLQLVLTDEHSGAEVSETLVITDVKALRSFYSKINRTRKPGIPVPEIDFAKEMVVITCSGERNDGALPTLAITKETTAQMVIATAFQSDENNTSQAITSPFSIYKMPLTDKVVVFEKANQ